MLTPARGALSRADLLRALVLAGEETEAPLSQRWAAALGYLHDPQALPAATLNTSPPDQTKADVASPPNSPRIITKYPPLSAPLFAITACDPLTEADAKAEAPQATAAVTGLKHEDCVPREPGGQPPFHPLVRPGKLWPRLKRAASKPRSGRRLDIPRLLQSLARGENLIHLPRRMESSLAGEIVVLVDQDRHLAPYQRDWQLILDQLARLAGSRALTVWTVRGDPQHPIGLWRRGQETLQPGELTPWPKAAAVLILSDLGALATPTARHNWSELAATGCICLPMTPHLAPGRLPRTLPLTDRAGWRSNRSQAAPQATHEPAQRLLTLLACARVIEPELLRALRLADPELAREPGLEALAWNAPALQGGEDYRLWRPEQAPAYRQRFRELEPARQLAVLDVLLACHGGRGRAIETQETLVWASHVAPATALLRQAQIAAAQTWWQAFVHEAETVAADDPECLAFASQTLAAQGEDPAFVAQRQDLVGPLWALIQADAWQSGRAVAVPEGLPGSRLAAWLARHGPAPAAADCHLAQQGEHLLLLPANLPAPSRMGMPLNLAAIEVRSGATRRYVRLDGHAQELARLQAGAAHTLLTPHLAYTVAPVPRPPWAQRFGRDRYGVYADLEIKGIVQRLRWIEPGEFWMGSPADEPERFADEGPRHRVRISKGYWLADTACTQALWRAVMGKNPSHFNKAKDAPRRPVETVSWDDVQGFLQRQRLPGVDLPTEAEWEYACRAGAITPFSFGANITPEQVNYEGDIPYASGKKGPYRQTTVAVTSLPANPWGLYEMHGNVWEWCADGLRVYEDRPEADPRGSAGTAPRAVRGGSWYDTAGGARSACRDGCERGYRNDDLGFRLVLRSDEPGQPEEERSPTAARQSVPAKRRRRK